ncbi:MAG: rhodanese-like domain-containing protein [Pseudomonadales bacterium]
MGSAILRRAGAAVGGDPTPALWTGFALAPLADPAALEAACRGVAAPALRGTLHLAPEGLNFTLWGPETALQVLFEPIDATLGADAYRLRRLPAPPEAPFRRLKIKARRHLIPLEGYPLEDPGTPRRGAPAAWHAGLDDPTIPVIDLRNDYEVSVGTFPEALNPRTEAFTDFPAWVAEHLDPARDRTVAMFCTGGIRCEKAAAWMRGQGFEAVLELDGGVLAYLDAIPEAEQRWKGECFVFDERVALTGALTPGETTLCHGCRRPLTPRDRQSNSFEAGVSCPYCIESLTPAQRAARRERFRQVSLAEARGEAHLAPQPKKDENP